VCAAVVVRTLARVAAYMPRKPASAEAEGAHQEGNGRLVTERRQQDGDRDDGHRGADQLDFAAHERHCAELDLAGDLLRLAFHRGIAHHRAENDKRREHPDDAHDERDQVDAHDSPFLGQVL
jgi:hypothetical protein